MLWQFCLWFLTSVGVSAGPGLLLIDDLIIHIKRSFFKNAALAGLA